MRQPRMLKHRTGQRKSKMRSIAAAARIALRTLQILIWALYALVVFAAVLGLRSIRARRLDRRIVTTAAGVSLRRALERLGATFIKLGQVASTRPDLIPTGIAVELAKLQEQVRPFPIDQVRRTIEEDFGVALERLFSEFEAAPLAAASVAQVHRARVAQSGELVAVKVRRPSIAAWAALDQSIALGFAHLLQ